MILCSPKVVYCHCFFCFFYVCCCWVSVFRLFKSTSRQQTACAFDRGHTKVPTMESMLKFIPSQRKGGRIAIHNGHMYTRHKKADINKKSQWVCVRRTIFKKKIGTSYPGHEFVMVRVIRARLCTGTSYPGHEFAGTSYPGTSSQARVIRTPTRPTLSFGRRP